MNELLQELDRVHSGIQHLDIQPTKNNVAIVLDALTVLEKVYAFVNDHIEEVTENGRDDSAE